MFTYTIYNIIYIITANIANGNNNFTKRVGMEKIIMKLNVLKIAQLKINLQ